MTTSLIGKKCIVANKSPSLFSQLFSENQDSIEGVIAAGPHYDPNIKGDSPGSYVFLVIIDETHMISVTHDLITLNEGYVVE